MERNELKLKNNAILEEGAEYQRKLFSTSFKLRTFIIFLGIICAYILKYAANISMPGEIFFILYIWLILDAIYLIILKSSINKPRTFIDNLHFSYYFPGIICATALVYYLGGLGWISFLFYSFDLIYANVLLKRLKSTLVTVFLAACYFSLLFLQYYNLLPQQKVYPLTRMLQESPLQVLSINMLASGILLILVPYSMGIFAKMKEERERDILESKRRFAAKSDQLEEITRTLRAQAAENKYLKSAAMGYLEKKEYELATAKKDLEDQIEKLRKTQKSMFFMIEDLNEMSAQLKDARDNLEDKVRERTDELLNINRKLHRSERLAFLGKLAGSVTHELRNPLSVLKNAVYFLESKFKASKDPKVKKYMDIITKEITLIDAIIEDIMGFAKTKSPELEKTNVKTVIENAISMIEVPDLIKIKKDFDKVPEIRIDANQVMHAVLNIANNAIMAMSGNGTLTFRILEKGDEVCIEVEDTGPGIPPDQRDLIFEPLYSSKPKGTGLGLPISKMMIENQEGRIEFDSELGKGTVFRILLPVIRGNE